MDELDTKLQGNSTGYPHPGFDEEHTMQLFETVYSTIYDQGREIDCIRDSNVFHPDISNIIAEYLWYRIGDNDSLLTEGEDFKMLQNTDDKIFINTSD